MQMTNRCPRSRLHSTTPLAYLPDHRWVISPRGYANVLSVSQTDPTDTDLESISATDEGALDRVRAALKKERVYGLLYELQPEDETGLDMYEGVGMGAYEKVLMDVYAVFFSEGEQVGERIKQALVYVDPRSGTGKAREEYVWRMNIGIQDALRCGMDEKWIEGAIRPFIPQKGV